MSSTTSNFSWILPTVNSDNNIWGGNSTGLNYNLIEQDLLIRDFMNNFYGSVAPVAPSIAQSGTMWVDSTVSPWTLKMYNSATTTWIPLGTIDPTNNIFNITGSSTGGGGGGGATIGDYKISAQPANHSQWLICDGSAISRSTYSGLSALFASLTPQYPFGNGNGTTTFNLPDLRGRVGGGIGSGSGLTTRVVGTAVGEENHTLTIAEMPSHNHVFNPLADSNTNGAGNPPSAVGVSNRLSGGAVNSPTFIENTGGGGGHNTMQPTLFAGNYFIYAGV